MKEGSRLLDFRKATSRSLYLSSSRFIRCYTSDQQQYWCTRQPCVVIWTMICSKWDEITMRQSYLFYMKTSSLNFHNLIWKFACLKDVYTSYSFEDNKKRCCLFTFCAIDFFFFVAAIAGAAASASSSFSSLLLYHWMDCLVGSIRMRKVVRFWYYYVFWWGSLSLVMMMMLAMMMMGAVATVTTTTTTTMAAMVIAKVWVQWEQPV